MSQSHGKFVWYELSTTDVAAAIRFYKDVVGWGTQDFEGAGMRYVTWTADGTGVGGVMEMADESRKNGAPPHWMAYVMVDDVDASVAKAKALGGTSCMPPSDIPTVGRIAILADPGGAVIATIRPIGPDAAQPMEVPDRHVAWHELMAGDGEAAFRFYSELFGWQKTSALESPMGTYQMFGRQGRTLGGMMTRPKDDPAPPHWRYYIRVPDLDDAVARVAKAGGRVKRGPEAVPDGTRIAQCMDPQGAEFSLNGL